MFLDLAGANKKARCTFVFIFYVIYETFLFLKNEGKYINYQTY